MKRRTFFQRIGALWTCIAPASILADDCIAEDDQLQPLSLRQEASYKGLCFLQVLRYLPHTDLYQARVSAKPESLEKSDLLVFFTEAQLNNALPYDCRVQGKPPEQILRILAARSISIRPLTRCRVSAMDATSKLTSSLLIPLDEFVEVTQDALEEACQFFEDHEQAVPECPIPFERHMSDPTLQQALLRAAINTLMEQWLQATNHLRSLNNKQALELLSRCALIVRLQRWQRRTRQFVINLANCWSDAQGLLVCRFTIGMPIASRSRPCAILA